MDKDSFDFKTQTLYKIMYERTYRPGDKDTVITSFLRHTPWHMEFGHPMELDGHVSCGEMGLQWEDILEIQSVSYEELKQWRIGAVKFISKIIDTDGHDPCFENVMLVRGYGCS